MFGLSSLVHEVNGIPLYNLSFDKCYKTLYKLTVESLGQDSRIHCILFVWCSRYEFCLSGHGTFTLYLGWSIGGEHSFNLARSIWTLFLNNPWGQYSIRLSTLNTKLNNQCIQYGTVGGDTLTFITFLDIFVMLVNLEYTSLHQNLPTHSEHQLKF